MNNKIKERLYSVALLKELGVYNKKGRTQEIIDLVQEAELIRLEYNYLVAKYSYNNKNQIMKFVPEEYYPLNVKKIKNKMNAIKTIIEYLKKEYEEDRK